METADLLRGTGRGNGAGRSGDRQTGNRRQETATLFNCARRLIAGRNQKKKGPDSQVPARNHYLPDSCLLLAGRRDRAAVCRADYAIVAKRRETAGGVVQGASGVVSDVG